MITLDRSRSLLTRWGMMILLAVVVTWFKDTQVEISIAHTKGSLPRSVPVSIVLISIGGGGIFFFFVTYGRGRPFCRCSCLSKEKCPKKNKEDGKKRVFCSVHVAGVQCSVRSLSVWWWWWPRLKKQILFASQRLLLLTNICKDSILLDMAHTTDFTLGKSTIHYKLFIFTPRLSFPSTQVY